MLGVKASLFNFDLGVIVKLFKRGDISKVYAKMYSQADDIATHEMINYAKIIQNKLKSTPPNLNQINLLDKMRVYRNKRIEYHIIQMKDLLKLYLQDKENKE